MLRALVLLALLVFFASKLRHRFTVKEPNPVDDESLTRDSVLQKESTVDAEHKTTKMMLEPFKVIESPNKSVRVNFYYDGGDKFEPYSESAEIVECENGERFWLGLNDYSATNCVFRSEKQVEVSFSACEGDGRKFRLIIDVERGSFRVTKGHVENKVRKILCSRLKHDI